MIRAAALLLVACASAPSAYRDIEGRPIPSTARIDADVAPVIVNCDGTRYQIVTVPHPYLVGAHAGTHRPIVRDARALCAKIAAND